MVSFWPWKGDDTSPASFEKALSSLSTKITKTNNTLDSLRQRSRRVNVLWILYAGFAYLLCSVILVLVVGWRKWGISEYVGVVLGPAIIYFVRLAVTTYYDYRTSSVQSQLDSLEQQRNKTIEKLKTATKYNSTQDLLKKYGGTPTPKEKPKKTDNGSKTQPNKPSPNQERRTNFAPPPTANIPNRIQTSSPQGPPQQRPPQHLPSPQSTSPQPYPRPSSPQSPEAEFAPNAFTAPPQYAQTDSGPKWYDRFMDVLLGEDESLPSKRFALICSQCRLVNGQAPPGVTRLEDVGKWRCSACGTTNGVEDEVKKIVRSVRREEGGGEKDEATNEQEPENGEEKVRSKGKHRSTELKGSESDVTQDSTDEEGDEDEEEKPAVKQTPRRRSTRPKKGVKTYDE